MMRKEQLLHHKLWRMNLVPRTETKPSGSQDDIRVLKHRETGIYSSDIWTVYK